MNEDSMKELERLRKQISQQEKMASLGLLSAGIAHEIQNPLNFVINFSKLSCKLLQDMEDVLDELESKLSAEVDEEIREIMDDLKSNMCKIEENGNRASSIVRGIRANNKSFNVTIIEEYDNTLPLVKVIPQDFSRAVLNLMNNACYAVFSKSKGVAENPYSPTIKVRLAKDSDRVRLVIEDNGPGITKEVKEKLYTPFFTTKPVGEGTGLGLSITKSIIEQKHNGTIEMESEPNEFTRFTITIPIK